ncbi:unnamed protein product [Rotaria magnacalcarata]|uniref:Transposase n=1 Tax=Rotaria magnacalcarata TaxID=392030 RepID=A0A816KAV0_9BILA|nr:unnamed protein product [Rotaria magnacalcarata]CAF4332787.1 unnamed protein product [Rotaria magnacalcarata]
MGRKAVDITTKRTIILLRASGMSQHEISPKLNISRNCIYQTIKKFNKLHTVATKPGAGRRSKLTDRQKRAIKLQQVRDDTLSQRYSRLQWCYQHLSWAENDWSNVIFTDESNFEILNRKNRIYIRRFRNDLKRFKWSQPRVHKGGGVGIWSYLTCHGLGPIVFYDGSLNSDKYIDILDQHLPTAYEKFLPQSPRKILLQQDNVRPHVSIKT